jgi:hypothetical protein
VNLIEHRPLEPDGVALEPLLSQVASSNQALAWLQSLQRLQPG